MGPPPLRNPEWFLRNIVDGKVMNKLLDRIAKFYDDLFTEVIYRAHHNSFKVSYADVFYSDFESYIVKACGLKKRVFWLYLPEESTLRHMYEKRKNFFRRLRKHQLFGDIRWSLDFWLSQLSFWYATVKAFASVWAAVVLDEEEIPEVVGWNEAITLYIISDFKYAAEKSQHRAVRERWAEKYKQYTELERGDL